MDDGGLAPTASAGLRLKTLRLLLGILLATMSHAAPPSMELVARIEKRHAECRVRLDSLYARIEAALALEAPDLAGELRRSEPRPVRHGYGVLPAIVPEGPPSASRARASVVSYSWPRTERGLDEHVARIDTMAAEIDRVAAIDPAQRRPLCEKIVRDWGRIPQDQRSLDAHIEYNRLWQGEISRNRSFYDRQTELLKIVVERQRIRDQLATGVSGETERKLRADEAVLASRVQETTHDIARSTFLRLKHPSALVSVIEVPVYTDIEDTVFLEKFRSAVESAWNLKDAHEEFRVAVAIQHIEPAEDGILFAKNLARFPTGAAILTTGALSTHVADGRCIALGPHDLPPRVLAHEFGHILGFKDAYFRGYRDLGADGFEVMEIVADPDDIMGSGGAGAVSRKQFERLIEVLQAAGH